MRLATGLTVIAFVCSTVLAGELTPGTLTLEDRVAAQKAIEQVYWNHRIWPKENPRPKPPLAAVMSDDVLRQRVSAQADQRALLRSYWNTHLTGDNVQGEIDRMIRGSKDPAMLRELFAALGNDPTLIAECLARPLLEGRLVEKAFARDARIHGTQRERIAQELAEVAGPEGLKRLSGTYAEVTVALKGETSAEARHDPETGAVLELEQDEWNELITRLSGRFGAGPIGARLPSAQLSSKQGLGGLPIGVIGKLDERDDAFVASAVLYRRANTLRLASASWPKIGLADWMKSQEGVSALATSASISRDGKIAAPQGGYTANGVSSIACVNDSWRTTWMVGLAGRDYHTTVWTGTEMIVWGGTDNSTLYNTGGRYNPSTDSWASSTLTNGTGSNVPSARLGHTAVWTGTEMIVWGGHGYTGYLNTGGRYDPSKDAWANTSLTTGAGMNVPSARRFHTAVWTGKEMIVWGGEYVFNYWNTGGRYNPATDGWADSSLTTGAGANVPSGRSFHTALWTGSEMIIWGGYSNPSSFKTGGRYDPSTDSWASSSLTAGAGANVPSARANHTAVWTGTEMIVWGGYGNAAYFNTGGRYDPSKDAWANSSLTTGTGANVPSVRTHPTAVWTGTEMIVWGGQTGGTYYNTGGRYNPSTDRWATSSLTAGTGANLPSSRVGHSAVWTGTEMIVWGGGANAVFLNTGGRYNPSTDSWASSLLTTNNGANAPSARYYHTTVWTGAEMIVWGGQDGTAALQTGGRYVPATDSWVQSELNTGTGTNAPISRWKHTAGWTGTEMIVWGGYNSDSYLNTGGRYSPATDSWAISTLTHAFGPNVPSARSAHRSVWTGTEMIVWGGYGGAGYLNTGGRYSPVTDGWVTTSTGANVPSGREPGNIVWTGTEMIVWGGWNGSTLSDGARYAPAADAWIPVSAGANVPSARGMHAAVWTGTEMIVWGGWAGAGSNTLSNGGRYNPSTDSWAPSSLTSGSGANVPISREYPTALWTGMEMVVWGGDYTSAGVVYCTNTGGRYNPATDTWATSSLTYGIGVNTPSVRDYHTAVLAGPLMIVWGGYDGANPLGDGATYCTATCPDVSWYQDLDEDGYGNSAVTTVSCTQPPGYVALSGDCNDANPAIHPGATEICNGVDDNCDGIVDNGDPATMCTASDACHVVGTCNLSTGTCSNPPLCTVLDQCHDVACDLATGTCLNPQKPDGSSCSDDNACTTGDACQAGICTPGYQTMCSATDQCHTSGICDPSTGYCSNPVAADGTTCSDGNACTQNDICQAGICVGSNAVVCTASDQCHLAGTCNTSTGICSTPQKPNGSVCSDGDVCTLGDNCQGGVCVGGSPFPCSDGNACTTDSCNQVTGQCDHVPIVCNDNNPCTDDSCDRTTGCVFTDNAKPCDDGSVCTVGDTCSGGVCRGNSIVCDDHNSCTTDTCSPLAGCVFTNNTNSCDDGNACTTNNRCGPPPHPTSFSENFDGATAPALPASWASSVVGSGNPWVAQNTSSDTPPNAAFGLDADQTADEVLDSPPISVTSAAAKLTFRNRWSFDNVSNCFDAGVLEIKIGTGPFADILASGGSFISGGYTGTVETYYSNPLAGRAAWCRTSAGYPSYLTTVVSLPAAAVGQTIRLRWRIGSDSSASVAGQDVDSIVIADSTNTCNGGPSLNCDDSNPCTDDSCDPASGCVHGNNTAACDDGNACTSGDVCSSGACTGTPIGGPPEVQNVATAADKTTYNWSAVVGATQYDVVRGSIGAFPIGPGGADETCFDNLAGPSLVDATVPVPGSGFWYLSRGANACGFGTWGSQSDGSPRTTTTCP